MLQYNLHLLSIHIFQQVVFQTLCLTVLVMSCLWQLCYPGPFALAREVPCWRIMRYYSPKWGVLEKIQIFGGIGASSLKKGGTGANSRKKYQYVSLHPVFGPATAYIGRRIAEATIAISRRNAQRLYRPLLRLGETKTSAGWIFETRLHQKFQCGAPFGVTNLGGSTTITLDIYHKSCKDFSQVSGVGSLLRKQPGSQCIDADIICGYFKPQHCNLCSLNSVAIAGFATTDKPVLVLFRMTVRILHPVKAQGLASIWAEIPEELRETPPILGFVVPDDVANRFSEQTTVPSGSRTSGSNTPDRQVGTIRSRGQRRNFVAECYA